MDKISNDIDNNQQTPQAEMYSLMNILKWTVSSGHYTINIIV